MYNFIWHACKGLANLFFYLQWFNVYYIEICPAMFGRIPCEIEVGGNEKFFISSSGNPINNCSNDLHHLREKGASNTALFA